MSVTIELLEYKYKQDNNINWSNNATNLIGWTTQSGISITNSSATSSVKFSSDASTYTGQYNGAYFNLLLTHGQEYKLSFDVVGYNNNGQGASNVLILGDSSAGGNNLYRPFGSNQITAGGVQTHTFTVDTTQNNNKSNFRFLVQLTNGDLADKVMRLKDVTLKNQTVLDGINWFESVVGELDITDNKNFPLAFTFQISDIKDITATSGDFSKTFKVPATKNNNNLLKHLYNPSINVDPLTGGHGVDVTDKLRCRINIDGLLTLSGVIKVTGAGGYGDNASYYNCIFLGNNIGWAEDLSDVYMQDIDWGSHTKNLTYNYTSISDTWTQTDCTTGLSDGSESLIVYPIMSHGEYNPDGQQNTIQMLFTRYEIGNYMNPGAGAVARTGYQGMTNNGTLYGNPDPCPDWRPAIWVKKTIDKIFSSIGYTVKSNFMNTQMFKQLVWTLPNFQYNNRDERYEDFSLKADFDTSVALGTYTGSQNHPGPWNTGFTFDPQYQGFGVDAGALNTAFSYNTTTSSTSITYTQGSTAQWTGFSDYPDSIYPGPNSTTLATGGGSYWTVAEYGYYRIQLSDLQIGIKDLLFDDGSGSGFVTLPQVYWTIGGTMRVGEFQIKEANYRIQRQSPGQTSWDNIATASDNPTFVGPAPFNLSTNLLVGSANGASYSSASLYYAIADATTEAVADIDDDIDFTYWLNKNDKIRILLQIKSQPNNDWVGSGNDGTGDFKYTARPIIGDFSIELDTRVVEWGQTYDFKDVINPKYKVIDYIKGVAHAFNLKMTTNEFSKEVTMEPFEEFYQPFKDAIDYTYKVDTSKLIEDKWLKSDLKRELIFKYKKDSKDEKVADRAERYFDGVEDEYPYQETLSNRFEKGESVFENPFFAGTYCAKDNETRHDITVTHNTAPTACLWEDDPSSSSTVRPDKGFEFMPRLLYWNKYEGGPDNYNAFSDRKWAATEISDTKIIYLAPVTNNASLTISSTGYDFNKPFPHAVSYNKDKANYPVLTYGNIKIRDYDDATHTYADAINGKGLYETYYKIMFEMLKSSPRVRTLYIEFKVSDIMNLDFKKLLYINGVYYRLNKIIDYQPNKNQSTKVELIEWLQLGSFAASAPGLDDEIIVTGGSSTTGGGSTDNSDTNMGF